MYPCSPSLRSFPVPGICFCQLIPVDRDARDLPGSPDWFSPIDAFPARPGKRNGRSVGLWQSCELQ
jgi:hypothetical protein